VYDGWTNSVRIGNTIFNNPRDEKSAGALRKVLDKHGFELETIDLSEFNKSGADLSCMCLTMSWRNRPEEPVAKVAAVSRPRIVAAAPMLAHAAQAAPMTPAKRSFADSM